MSTPTVTKPTIGNAGDLEKRAAKPSRRSAYLLVVPGILGLALGFIIPLLYMIRMSLNRGGTDGMVEETFTFDMYSRALGDYRGRGHHRDHRRDRRGHQHSVVVSHRPVPRPDEQPLSEFAYGGSDRSIAHFGRCAHLWVDGYSRSGWSGQ